MLFWISLVIFAVTLILVITERIHRSVAVIVGAVSVLLTGIMDIDKAIHYVDFETLLLLLGMMTIVEILRELGLFHFLAIKIAKLSGGYRTFFYLITLATGILSPFLHSVTIMLIFSAITVAISRIVNKDPRPLLLAQLFTSNIGGNMTLVGEPTNMMVGLHAKLGFLEFFYVMTPLTILNIIFVTFYLGEKYGIKDEPLLIYLEELDEYSFVKDMKKLKIGVAIFILTVVLFFLGGFINLSPSIIALLGSVLMLIFIQPDISELLSKIPWDIIIFIGGFFILVGGLVETGVIHYIASIFTSRNFNSIVLIFILAFLSAIASGFIPNIPLVAVMIPVLDELTKAYGSNILWYALLVGANFGGNLTPIAGSPNVVILAVCDRENLKLSFKDFMHLGIPVVMITVFVGLVMLSIMGFTGFIQ